MINYETLVRVLKNGGFRKSNELTNDDGIKLVDFINTRRPKTIYTAVLNPKYPGTAEKVLKTDVTTFSTSNNGAPKVIPINGLVELKKDLGL